LSSSIATGWPPKSFCASESAGAEQRFTSADHVTVDNGTAASTAAGTHDESSAVKPIADTSGVWKAGSITGTGSNCTENDSA
jgi:hypothetical protein